MSLASKGLVCTERVAEAKAYDVESEVSSGSTSSDFANLWPPIKMTNKWGESCISCTEMEYSTGIRNGSPNYAEGCLKTARGVWLSKEVRSQSVSSQKRKLCYRGQSCYKFAARGICLVG